MTKLYLTTREEWRAWLMDHHATEKEVWLVYHKRHTGQPRIPYEDAVEEALCFGWIDSIVRRIDDATFAQKFTPRRPGSQWSELNRRRFARVVRDGKMTEAGLAKSPPAAESTNASVGERAGTAPPYISIALKKHKRAFQNFQNMAPSYQRLYVRWIDSAQKEETRRKRLKEVIERLFRNEKPGLK